MGAFDNLGDKAKDFAGEHEEQVDQGLDKAGEFADEKTGGEHSDQIDQGKEKVSGFLGGDDGGGEGGDGGGGDGGGEEGQ